MPENTEIRRYNFKLLLGIGMIMALAVPLIASAMHSLLLVTNAQNEFLLHEVEEMRLAQDLQLSMSKQLAIMPVYVFTGDPELLKDREKACRQFDDTLGRLRRTVDDAGGRKLLDQIKIDQDELTTLGIPGIRLRQEGASIEKVNAYFRDTTTMRTESIMNALRDFARLTQDAFETGKVENARISARTIDILGLAAAAGVFLALVVVALLMQLLRQKHAYDRRREELLDKERQLSKARKDTVEVVAHDLKNPLSSILLSTQLAFASEPGSTANGTRPDMHLALDTISRSAHSMNRLIHDLLDHAKIESGTLQMERKQCQVEELLQDLYQRHQPIAEARKLAFSCDVPATLRSVSLDSARMEQVLSNLLGNALKFTPPGGSVGLSAREENQELLLRVSDTGPGMTEEQAAHIFERYWQVRDTARQGTGLGLSIAQAIVTAHGGRLSVETGPGRGSVFSIILPNGT